MPKNAATSRNFSISISIQFPKFTFQHVAQKQNTLIFKSIQFSNDLLLHVSSNFQIFVLIFNLIFTEPLPPAFGAAGCPVPSPRSAAEILQGQTDGRLAGRRLPPAIAEARVPPCASSAVSCSRRGS